MKSLNSFLQYILEDLGMWCRTSTDQDLKTILARIEHEGWSFLTITLAQFGKDFERSLELGYVDPTFFAGFQRRGGLPRIFSGFLDRVFLRSTGVLLEEPDVACIWAIRQITLMFAKISLPCTDARRKAAIEGYLETERSVHDTDAKTDHDLVRRFHRIGVLLWADVFSRVDEQVHNGEITPKHGPGNTAERLRGNAKWAQQEWTLRLEQVFPHGEHLASSWRYFQYLEHVQLLAPGAERPVRVITVPKTLKTPRIIALEPTCMQYMQQGLLGAISKSLDSDRVASGFVGWSSQVPNQHLARTGSRNGATATLDLSEASDRVSNQHVRGLLRNHRWLASAVDSSRSRKADVPGYGVIPLAKFASMGSALCFPFESMVFCTMVFVAIEEDLGRPVTRKDIASFLGKVRVYGDDIIVPVEHVHSTMRVLEAFGLRVNASKSFWTGKFRESCGGDYYDGDDVSVVRMRREFPARRQQSRDDWVLNLVSTVSLRNQLYNAGLWRSTGFLDRMLEGIIPFPYVGQRSPVLGRHSFLGIEPDGKMCPDLHVPLVRGVKVRSKIPVSRLEDYAALNKCLSALHRRQPSLLPWEERRPFDAHGMPTVDDKHLEKAGRPRSVGINIAEGPAA